MGDQPPPSFVRSLLAGAVAGTTVDIVLFPLDTLKTRLQAPKGFWGSGGFKGIYNGLLPVVIGSAPGAAFFFCTYDTVKAKLPFEKPALNHMAAAALGELAGCLVRVPTETVKQRLQAGIHPTMGQAIQAIVKEEGLFRGLYAGYPVTVSREIPFALIQFPLWEWLKQHFAYTETGQKNDIAASFCGAVAGAVAAGITTPLDVVKTRIMLGKDKDGVAYSPSAVATARRIVKDEGYRVLFNGLVPRVKMIGIGGLIFFGAYEHTHSMLASHI